MYEEQPMNTTAVEDLLAFWFSEQARERWWRSTPAFDALVRERFAGYAAAALDGSLDDWRASAEGALALVLLLDQVPRNIHRGTPAAFAGGEAAVAVTEHALVRGFDEQLDEQRRAFLYMPLMHSEDLEHQRRCVALFELNGPEGSLKAARQHRDIVERFGRFPHRNDVLGRESTAAERDYLAGDDAFRG